jgi:hypothetical protein
MDKYNQLIASLENLLVAGEWRGVLNGIANQVITVVRDPRAKAVVFGSPELDRLCSAAGAMALQTLGVSQVANHDSLTVVHIATELYYRQGGHTLALKDVIRAQPDVHHVVLLTNLHDRQLMLDKIMSDMDMISELHVAPPGDVGVKLLWLFEQLHRIRPGRLMLFQHHHDVVAIAAAQPHLAADTFYFHHCDSEMALGVYLPHAWHADYSSFMFQLCRDSLGVNKQVYWPLVAQDLGARARTHEFKKDGDLTTCSHGSHNKFLAPGQYGYFDLIIMRLEELAGTHVHIGYLPDNALQSFVGQLQTRGIDIRRFQYVPPVTSLWQYLRDSDVDICISSFPLASYKGLVETMGAGIPILIYQNKISINHSRRDLVYDRALWWDSPDVFIDNLKSLTPEMLAEHAVLARAHYEKWHHPRELAYALATSDHTIVPPSVPHRYQYDNLARYIHDYQ